MPNRPTLKPLRGVRIVSLALNLPGPAALMVLHGLGARCTKIDSPAGDPMQHYSPPAYQQLHAGVRVLALDLKTPAGQARLARHLVQADVLLTSFRPAALSKLGLNRARLKQLYPGMAQVAIFGQWGDKADEPGHDLTYLAENGLITGTQMPATLYADMAGAQQVVQAVLGAVLMQKMGQPGAYQEVALADAAAYLALPRQWGLTGAQGLVGGAHAGYRVYACQDGRVAVAALEPHFAQRLCQAAGLTDNAAAMMTAPRTHRALARYFAGQTQAQLRRLASTQDLPLHTLPADA